MSAIFLGFTFRITFRASEPARTFVRYYFFRSPATFLDRSPHRLAGCVEGRRRRPEPEAPCYVLSRSSYRRRPHPRAMSTPPHLHPLELKAGVPPKLATALNCPILTGRLSPVMAVA